eukprot:CAMPEP_0179188848 /NCGR_PEP_ID=MMETSP0796-20121207/93738_1 /TAXON_ID=73915 /ORGANISM="Pyrodinium bahamense, Strain pbaha01" /LENGTH=297 /DNA_ID=CAMNT_0020892965 /DNA_START=423 /DNA_END=1316 /DNA_ORIENTATION=-
MIIALPAIYAVMAMSSLVRMCQVLDDENTGIKNAGAVKLAMSQSETCFRVGDLYEAWALYQFGKLTIELIKTGIAKQENSLVDEQRGAARGLLMAHVAVESQMSLGTWMFVVVCVLQSGWSCWMKTFAAPEAIAASLSSDAQFTAAGTVASVAAIYNVHAVERTYQPYLEGYSPFLKFVSLKMLVSLAFFQRGAFAFLQVFQKTLPSVLGKILPSMPIMSELINFSKAQFEAFYAALYEIFVIAALHGWAWNATEQWYGEYLVDALGADGVGEASQESRRIYDASTNTYKSASAAQA